MPCGAVNRPVPGNYHRPVTVIETVASTRISGAAERLACHPRLPLVAVLDSERPAVHVWSFETGDLREVGAIGADSEAYGGVTFWDRMEQTPGMAWHPEKPLLVAAAGGSGVQWTPAGLSDVEAGEAGARYVAFSPDGRTLWWSPPSNTGTYWDTGVATHPGGDLVLTLVSDQGATLGLFARVDHGAMRVLRKGLILDVDGYETPVFSADGRLFAIRGNAYAHTLEVFEFPSLRRVLATVLSESEQDYSVWSLHNTAFGATPGVLWIGTPAGSLIEIDVAAQSAVTHDVLAGSKVTALGRTASGGLVVAGAGGELVLLSVHTDAAAASVDSATESVAAFLASTSDVPDSADPEPHLLLTDGHRVWEADDLDAVTSAEDGDPTWLRLQAAVNEARDKYTSS